MGHKPRCSVQRRAEVVTSAFLRLAGEHPHSHGWQTGRRQLGLSLRGARKGVGRAGERHCEAIAPGGEDEAAMTADQATHKRVVAR